MISAFISHFELFPYKSRGHDPAPVAHLPGVKVAVLPTCFELFPSPLMAVKTHSWISLWFLLTVPVIAWDVTYCMMRLVTLVAVQTTYTDVPYLTLIFSDHGQ